MENGESEARRCVERTKLDIHRAPNESIRSWILGTLKMKRKLKNICRMIFGDFSMGEMFLNETSVVR